MGRLWRLGIVHSHSRGVGDSMPEHSPRLIKTLTHNACKLTDVPEEEVDLN